MPMGEVKGRQSSMVAVSIIGGLFFLFGFVTWLNGAPIPFLTIACDLDHLQAYFVTLVFYIAYTVMALPMFMMCGYLLGVIAIPRWITHERARVVSAALGILLSILILVADVESDRVWQTAFAWTGFQPLPDAVLIVALFGLANALVWPAGWRER